MKTTMKGLFEEHVGKRFPSFNKKLEYLLNELCKECRVFKTHQITMGSRFLRQYNKPIIFCAGAIPSNIKKMENRISGIFPDIQVNFLPCEEEDYNSMIIIQGDNFKYKFPLQLLLHVHKEIKKIKGIKTTHINYYMMARLLLLGLNGKAYVLIQNTAKKRNNILKGKSND